MRKVKIRKYKQSEELTLMYLIGRSTLWQISAKLAAEMRLFPIPKYHHLIRENRDWSVIRRPRRTLGAAGTARPLRAERGMIVKALQSWTSSTEIVELRWCPSERSVVLSRELGRCDQRRLILEECFNLRKETKWERSKKSRWGRKKLSTKQPGASFVYTIHSLYYLFETMRRVNLWDRRWLFWTRVC